MQHQANQLDFAVMALESEAELQLVSLRRRQNTLVAFHRLPLEVVIEIFRHILVGERHDYWKAPAQYHYGRYLLMQVSRRWYDVVTGCPQFWTVITNTYRPEVWMQALPRSGTHPLHIVWDQR